MKIYSETYCVLSDQPLLFLESEESLSLPWDIKESLNLILGSIKSIKNKTSEKFFKDYPDAHITDIEFKCVRSNDTKLETVYYIACSGCFTKKPSANFPESEFNIYIQQNPSNNTLKNTFEYRVDIGMFDSNISKLRRNKNINLILE